jgi:predicted permease
VVRARFRSFWRRLRHRGQFERQVSEEIAFHLEARAADLAARHGLSRDQALRRARLEFGSVGKYHEEVRASVGLRYIDELRSDLRYAARSLRQTPAFSIVAIFTLAFGVGANTAIFSLVDAVLLQTLPVERPHELVLLQSARPNAAPGTPPYPWFERLRAGTDAFSGMAAFAGDELRVVVDGRVEQVFGQIASGSYFDVLGLRPAAGRLLTTDDERLDPPVAVLGYDYWQRRFNGDRSAIGRTMAFGNRVFSIVGVAPAGFHGLTPGRRVDVTLPITESAAVTDIARWGWFDGVARLRSGISHEQATAQADAVLQSFLGDHPESTVLRREDRAVLPDASRGGNNLRNRFSTPLYLLMLAAGIVLLVACVNLANLLLARGAARAREFAIRLAIGSSPGRLFRQLITETLVLFLMGTAAGLLIADAIVGWLTGFFAIGRNPILLDVPFDWRRAAFAAALALSAGLSTALWPAWRAVRTHPVAAIKEGDVRLAGSRRLAVWSRLTVTAQVALSLVLLVASLMFVETLAGLRRVDLGFNGTRVLTMSLTPAFGGGTAPQARPLFFTRVLEAVRASDGVRAASLSVLTPLSGRDTGRGVAVAGFEPRSERDRMIRLNHVSEDYFRTFGIDLVAGRPFSARDGGGATKVAVVNEAAVRFYFAGRSPVGETLRFGDSVYQVVGVVRDHKHRNLREVVPPFAYVPIWQPLDPMARITLAVSSDLPTATMARTVRAAVQAIHPDTLVSDVIDVQEQIAATLIGERLVSALATGFAALALLLAGIGLYGVLTCSVARRRAEFGIRLALGAPRARVAAGAVGDVMRQVAAGVAIGLPAALVTTRAAESLLFGVTAADPANYLIGAVVLLLVAGVASWLPARRASRVDPMVALRYE